jgi:hypothetical protein
MSICSIRLSVYLSVYPILSANERRKVKRKENTIDIRHRETWYGYLVITEEEAAS